MTDTDRSARPALTFGLNGVAPPDAQAVWGARFIYPDDLVWDRVAIAGSQEAREELCAWLDGPSDYNQDGSRLRSARRKARLLADQWTMTSGDDALFTLYADRMGRIVANPRKSFGYLYVAAWLEPPSVENEHYITIKDARAEELRILELLEAADGARMESWGVLKNGVQTDGGTL